MKTKSTQNSWRIFSFAGVLLASALAASAASGSMNILWIVSDDHSWPQLGVYGDPNVKTPNLDRFAAQGMRFNRAYVTAPQCLPSRVSLVCGRDPVGMGMTRFSAPLPKEFVTFPEILRANGFFVGFAGRPHHLQGWSYTTNIPPLYAEMGLLTVTNRCDFVEEANAGTAESRRVDFFNELDDFFRVCPTNKPFFLQFGLLDPHRQFSDRKLNSFANQFDPAKMILPPDFPDTPAVRDDLALFCGMVARMDFDVGRVLKLLDERGLATNTIVVFIGDNGAALFRGKGCLYDMGIRVPLIIRWPGVVKANSVSDALISGTDLAPTMLEAAGFQPLPTMTGRSLVKLLKGEPFQEREFAFAERGAHGDPLPSNTAALDLSRCVVSQQYKFIYNALWQLPYWPVDFYGQPVWLDLLHRQEEGMLDAQTKALYFAPHRPVFELYDLKNDPHELTNLAGKPEFAAEEFKLKMALTKWMIQEHDFLPLPAPDAPWER